MKCPICKRKVNEPATDEPRAFFPFCSDRCNLIDLGRWLDGKYQIPIDELNDAPGGESPEGNAAEGQIDPDEPTPRQR